MQLMFWEAEYKDGSKINEKTHEFNDIDKSNLRYFRLEGLNTFFEHDVEKGTCKVNKNIFTFKLDGKDIGVSTDVINFKKAQANVMNGQGMGIVGYYTGWKEKIAKNNSIEVLFWVDLKDKKLKLRVRLTPLKPQHEFTTIINEVVNTKTLGFNELNKKKEFVFEL